MKKNKSVTPITADAGAIAGSLSSGIPISPRLQEELQVLIGSVPPLRVSRHLRELFMSWLKQGEAGLPLDYEDFLLDMECLFEFLDALIDEAAGIQEYNQVFNNR